MCVCVYVFVLVCVTHDAMCHEKNVLISDKKKRKTRSENKREK